MEWEERVGGGGGGGGGGRVAVDSVLFSPNCGLY